MDVKFPLSEEIPMVKFLDRLISIPKEKSSFGSSYPIIPGVTVVSYSIFSKYLLLIA